MIELAMFDTLRFLLSFSLFLLNSFFFLNLLKPNIMHKSRENSYLYMYNVHTHKVDTSA